MIIQNKSKRLVLSGLFLAVGLILPYVTAHGFGMQGNILLPMHIPVFLCGFICGPLYGTFCGLMLPVINSLITGMPAMYPMAIFMTIELGVYGLSCGILAKTLCKKSNLYMIYISLILSMIAGRVAYGLVAWLLLFAGAIPGRISIISSVATGLPGIIIQLILIPAIVSRGRKIFVNPRETAIDMIKSKRATCVTVRKGDIETQGVSKGIAYIIDLFEKDLLCEAFVADKVVGKAAAMIFTLGKVNSVYAENISDSAIDWLKAHNIPFEYARRSKYIINRTGDGMCPMELTVADINDEKEAIQALKEKIEELKNK